MRPPCPSPTQNCDIDAQGVCSPSDGAGNFTDVGAVPVAAMPSTVNYRPLIIILDYSQCGLAPSVNESIVRSLFLGPDGDGSGGFAWRCSQCSYGRFQVNTTALRVITVPANCTTAVTSSCSWYEFSTGGDKGAKAQLGSAAFALFSHYVYVVPPGLTSVCPWSGLALLPGNQIWLTTSGYGLNRWATVMQETLHNYGE